MEAKERETKKSDQGAVRKDLESGPARLEAQQGE
jgi:hypothetical protein